MIGNPGLRASREGIEEGERIRSAKGKIKLIQHKE